MGCSKAEVSSYSKLPRVQAEALMPISADVPASADATTAAVWFDATLTNTEDSLMKA